MIGLLAKDGRLEVKGSGPNGLPNVKQFEKRSPDADCAAA